MAETGLTSRNILRIVSLIRYGKRVSFWWTMAVNPQSYQGVRTAQSLINLALMTGNIGRPGTGANSITGQCNAMGSRLFLAATSLLGGHDFQNPEHRSKVARLLDLPVEKIPTEQGWAYPEMMSGILAGKIKGLWIVATNPDRIRGSTRIRQRNISGRLDFLVVQDMYSTTETVQMADCFLRLPGGEKDGTFINSERRIGTIRKVRKAPDTLSDFAIFKLVAKAWGCEDLFRKWSSPEAAFQILK